MRAARPPIDAEWLDQQLAELEGLVAENDMLGVTTKLKQIVDQPERVGDAVLEDTLHEPLVAESSETRDVSGRGRR